MVSRVVPVACALAVCLPGDCQALPTEDDLILLQPYLDQRPLGDGIEAYRSGDVVLVPLGELCRLLSFGITVNPSRSAAGGFFIHPRRTFVLDLDRGEVLVEGRRAPLGKAVRMPRDLYVDARSLAAWFPLELEVQPRNSSLVIKAKEKLPVQEAWERDRAYGSQSLARYGGQDAPTRGVFHPTPYSFLDLPMVDLDLGLARSQGSSATPVAGSATVGGDLLWMSSDLYPVRDTSGSWSSSRYTLFREDPEAGLLGPLRARRVDLGDLPTAPTMDLVGSLPQGRGLNLDNYPVTYRTRFSARTFRGPLAEGWSVEFYQNDALVAFQKSRPDGLYEFPDVPLRFGVNIFRLVFHGPLGELVEKTIRLDIAQSQPAPGSVYYGISGVRPVNQNLAVASDLETGTEPDLTRAGYLARADCGLSTVFSVQGGVAGMQLQDGYHDYQSLGLRGVWSFLALQVTGAQDHRPGLPAGNALEGVLATGYGYSTLTLRRDQFSRGFERSVFDTATLGAAGYVVKDANGAELDVSGKVWGSQASLSAEVDSEDYVGGATGVRDRFLVSAQAAGITFSNSVSVLRLPGSDQPMQGTLMATAFTRHWDWSGSLYYGPSQVNGWGFQAQLNADPWQYQVSCRGPLGSPATPGYAGPIQVGAGVTHLTGRFGLGLSAQASSQAWSAALQFLVSLGREPRTGKWTTDAQSLATTGSVSAVAFVDRDGNGVRDPGEPILEGARFRVSDSETPNQIRDPAVTLFDKLARSQPVDISLDESSLADPSQKAAVKTYTVLPRPGKVAQLEFPVTTFGEIDGTTRALRDGRKAELGGLEVELLDAQGRRVKAQRSAYDGFFEFADLPFGDYLLRVTPEEAARMHVKPAERRIRIQAGHNFLEGQDLTVEPRD
jgi:hypothetical protein